MQKVHALISEKNRNQIINQVFLNLEQEIDFVNQVAQLLNEYNLKEQLEYISDYGTGFSNNLSIELFNSLIEYYYEEHNPHQFLLNEKVVEYMIYTNKASWYRHEKYLEFLTDFPQANIKKAGLVIELVSFYERKNFDISSEENQKKLIRYYEFFSGLLDKWQKEDIEKNVFNHHLSYYVIHNLYVNKKQKHLSSYILEYVKPFSEGIQDSYPHLIDQFKRTYLLDCLLNLGYNLMYQNNPQLTQEKILFFVENNFFEQAQLFIDKLGLDVDTLEKTQAILDEKRKRGFQSSTLTRIQKLDNGLEAGYLNHKIDIQEKKEVKKIKI